MDEHTKYLLDLNEDNLRRTIGFVDVIDSKAKFVLTVVLALTAYLVTQVGPFADAHSRWGTVSRWAPIFFVLLDLAAACCLVCFVAAAIKVIRVITPRVGQHSGRPSPLFFDTIAKMPLEDFKAAMKHMVPNEYLDRVLDQCYDNAKILQLKTATVLEGIRLLYGGMLCFFVFTVGRPILLSIVGR